MVRDDRLDEQPPRRISARAQAGEIFDGGRTVSAGVFAPRGGPSAATGGYVVSGRWSFVSGVQHSDWMMGGCIVQRWRQPVLLASRRAGRQADGGAGGEREVIDTWSVVGTVRHRKPRRGR